MRYPKRRYTGPKPWMDYDWLYEQYVVRNRRTAEIAEEYGCKQNTIQCWLSKHGIKKTIVRRRHEKKKNYEMFDYLYHNHIELHKSMAEIARDNGVSGDTIRENLKKNGITPWKSGAKTKFSDADVDKMSNLYCDSLMSANKIAKAFGTDHNTIIRKLQSRGIKPRGLIEAQYAVNGREMPSDLLNSVLLRRLHWDEGLSCKEIGARYGVDAGSIRRQMHRIGVKTKTNAESKVGLMVRDRHPNWKGGVTPLNYLLREYFHTNLAPVVVKRDKYTCQLCGAKHTVLHVHHIRPFSEIIDEICSEHNDLNVNDIEDRERLYEIITNDQRFLDTDNLITFCKDCHLFEIHNYNRKTISSQASTEEGSETIPCGSTP